MIKIYLLTALVSFYTNFVNAQSNNSNKNSQKSFTEGIVYSRTSFPGHAVDGVVKKINFDKGDIDKQYKSLRGTIAEAPEVKKDQMYLMALALMPVISKTFFTPQKSLTQMLALGYEWQALLDHTEGKGRIFLQTHDLQERGTINFKIPELRKVWEKEDVGQYEGEYVVKYFTETTVLAGYPCKKVIYSFSGTSQGPVAHSKIVSATPWKVTAWYSDEVDPGINVQNPFYIKLNKAILKTEVEFDKDGKKKMLYEVTRLEPRKIDEDELKLPELGETVNHETNGMEALPLIMRVMATAGQITWK